MENTAKKSCGSIVQIAQMAEVSVATVSRVFNKHHYVRDSIRQRVFDAAAQLGYTPKLNIRKDTVAIIGNSWDKLGQNIYEATILSSILQETLLHKLNVEIVPMNCLELLDDSLVRAAVIMSYDSTLEPQLTKRFQKLPLLMLNNIIPGYGYVCSDHYECMNQAVNYLIMNGHRNIGIIFSPYQENMSWGEKERLRGYQTALEQNGIVFKPELVGFDRYQMMENLGGMIHMQQATAIIVCGEAMVLPCWHGLQLLNKKIPEDISLVLFDSPGITPYLIPRPAVIKQNFQALGVAVVSALNDIISGKNLNPEVILPATFVPGPSIKPI